MSLMFCYRLLDDGRLTDGKGRVVDFKNTIIIMTSNIGSHHIKNSDNLLDVKDLIFKEIHTFFKPEFLNRIDDIILFHKLSKENIGEIVKIQLKNFVTRLNEKNIEIETTQKAIDYIADIGFDPQFGARPLKRAIQTYIENEIAKDIIAGKIGEKSKVTIDSDGEKIFFK